MVKNFIRKVFDYIMKVFKKNLSIFVVLFMMLFSFISCGESGYTKVVKKFLTQFKNSNVPELQKYLLDGDNLDYLKNFIDKKALGGNSDTDNIDISKHMLSKALDFKYEIMDSVKEGNKAKVNVKFNYYDLFRAYESALSEFLSRSLDFNNLDDIYNINYINNLLIEHINKLKIEEKVITLNLVKEKGWKINLDDNLTEILTGNSIKFVNSFKDIVGNEK